MIVAVERNKFNYLYKYNRISIDANQALDLSMEKLSQKIKEKDTNLIFELERILPVFEQDHEIILLEIDKNKVSIEGKLTLYFNSVLSIYPLTKIGSQLLQGKLNEDFIINPPIFEDLVDEIKTNRSLENRRLASENLMDIFSLNLEISKKEQLYYSLKRILLNQNMVTYMDYLISYNKTPNNIPEGNIEFICKIGIVVLNYLKIDETNFFKGPFYKSCLTFKNEINNGNIYNSYTSFIEIKEKNLSSSLETLKSKIPNESTNVDMFKVSYFFLAFKSFLNKNDRNLILLQEDIQQLIFDDEETAVFVMAMIGYTFSFELLYESLHALSKAPLIKMATNQTIKAEPIIIKTKKIVKKEDKIIKKNINSVENDSHLDMVLDEISIATVVYESNINNENSDKTDLTLFAEVDNGIDKNETIIDDEVTKSTRELLNWINGNKLMSKSATSEWKKFIEKYLKYGNHSLIDIFNKVKNENLDKKLTAKMLIDLEKFYT